ncbi:hypothetical protein SOJ_04900 [Staphylococcus sp. OJ82]|nr:hypothetical protein SOJ_04900 [Staphylococcus sp. OJ82]
MLSVEGSIFVSSFVVSTTFCDSRTFSVFSLSTFDVSISEFSSLPSVSLTSFALEIGSFSTSCVSVSIVFISLISNASPLLLPLSLVLISSNSAACASLPTPNTNVAPIKSDAVPTVNFLIEYLFILLGKNPCLFFIIFPPQNRFVQLNITQPYFKTQELF